MRDGDARPSLLPRRSKQRQGGGSPRLFAVPIPAGRRHIENVARAPDFITWPSSPSRSVTSPSTTRHVPPPECALVAGAQRFRAPAIRLASLSGSPARGRIGQVFRSAAEARPSPFDSSLDVAAHDSGDTTQSAAAAPLNAQRHLPRDIPCVEEEPDIATAPGLDPPPEIPRPVCAIDRLPALGTPFSERTFEVLNPSTRELLAEPPDMGVEETRAAIDKACSAQPGWAALTAREPMTFCGDGIS